MARRSRTLSLPRWCCLATLSAPPISRALARRASRSATISRIFTPASLRESGLDKPLARTGSFACSSLFSRPLRGTLLQERGQAFACVGGGQTLGQAVAKERKRRLQVQIVLRGEGAQPEAHGDGALAGDGVGDLLHFRVERLRRRSPVQQAQ